ncbi:GNAT family N-acetyltransferase [Roseivivax marinus]|uniref:GNAT family N-acetyltransferase n=1 Tax=Roseivivax marinus TaxID=1379903 RepID=UPI00103CEF6A|nr:GNAT family N-acetyltransferase [Roseivivax marinus]
MKNGECFILTAGIPQSAEKPVSDRPEHIVLIQCSEKRSSLPDGRLNEASIEIRIASLSTSCPTETWGATYRCGFHDGGSVRLSNGFIGIPSELQGRRVGTWVMDEVVSWAKQWPDARVEPIRLQQQQAKQNNKLRRNRFYNRFGFQFDLETDEGSSPHSLVASQLKTVEKPENIEKMPPERKIRSLLEERDNVLMRLKHCENGRKNDWKVFKKSRRRLRVNCAILCGATFAVAILICCVLNPALF